MCDLSKPTFSTARYQHTEKCTFHHSSRWNVESSVVQSLSPPLHGHSSDLCVKKCLAHKKCNSFTFGDFQGQPDTCRLSYIDLDNKSEESLVESLSASRTGVGLCDRSTTKEGDVRLPSIVYNETAECRLVHPVQFRENPRFPRRPLVLENATKKYDEQSCAQACIDTPECSAFDVFIDKTPGVEHTDKDPRAGQCRIYALELPEAQSHRGEPDSNVLEASGLLQLVQGVTRDQVVGFCRRRRSCGTL